MHICHIFLSLAFIITVQNSYAEICTDAKPDIVKDLKNISDIADSIEDSPFIVACKNPPDLLKNRPKTGLFVRNVVEKDHQGRTTRAFLKKVLAKAKQRVNDSKNQILNIKKCMELSSPQCAEIKNWVEIELPQFVKEARYHLSLSQSQNEIKTWASIASTKVNNNLDSLGSYKFNKWKPLNNVEKILAKKQLAEYRSEIKTVTKEKIDSKEICITCGSKFSDEALLTVRFQHYQTYHQMLSELPIMQYLTGPQVNKMDLDTAFNKMSSDLEVEKKQLDDYETILNKPGPLPTDVLKILNYSSQLEEALIEDNKDCGLASSLVYTMSNRQLGNAIAIGLPVLAVSMFAVPVAIAFGSTAAVGAVVGVGTGVTAGGALAVTSFNDFKETQKRTMSHIYGDTLGSDLKSLEDSYKRAKYDAVTLPVGFGLGSFAVRSLVVGTKSFTTGRKVFQKN